MAPGTALGAAGDAPPRPEHARPPGWAPPVRPPPAPVAALPAAALRPAPPPARPRPAPAARSAASAAAAAVPAQPAATVRPEFFGILAWFLGFRLVGRASELLTAGAAAGMEEAVGRMIEAGSVACGAALVLGLWRCEQWVGRAAVAWAGSLGLLHVFGGLYKPPYLEADVFSFASAMIVPALTAMYVWDKARGFPPAAAPATSP